MWNKVNSFFKIFTSLWLSKSLCIFALWSLWNFFQVDWQLARGFHIYQLCQINGIFSARAESIHSGGDGSVVYAFCCYSLFWQQFWRQCLLLSRSNKFDFEKNRRIRGHWTMASFKPPAPVHLSLPSDSLWVGLSGWITCGNLPYCKWQDPVSTKILLFPKLAGNFTTLF